jgi:hypothetical protein
MAVFMSQECVLPMFYIAHTHSVTNKGFLPERIDIEQQQWQSEENLIVCVYAQSDMIWQWHFRIIKRYIHAQAAYSHF